MIIWGRLTDQGIYVTALWAVAHLVRIAIGAPIQSLSQVSPHLHVGGQYRQRGWHLLRERGITAVVNLRTEFDDEAAGIAPERYLYLPTIDDCPPSVAQLQTGVVFIEEEIRRGGSVYVHCGAGVGRAPTMVAAYLVSTGLTTVEAWARIRQVRPFIRPKRAQIAQVRRFAESLRLKG